MRNRARVTCFFSANERYRSTMNKRIVSVLAIGLFAILLPAAASAQNGCPLAPDPNNCMRHMSWDDFPSTPPVGTVCCSTGAFFSTFCNVPTPPCGAPPNAARETCLSCNGAKTVQVSRPIDLATGNTYIVQTDLSIPGLGGGLVLSRTWNSMLPSVQNTYPFMFGTSWRSTYEERLIYNSPDHYLKYTRADGSVWSFAPTGVGFPAVYVPVAPANDATTITSGATVWTLAFKNGEKRFFDPSTGILLSLGDRNGNATTLSYDSANRLVSVADAAGRHLNFTYTSSTSNLVQSLTSDVGITLTYSYDSSGRLVQVIRPDQTTVSFDYDGQSHITAVKDSDGKILESHAYDISGRGTSASRALGADAVTVTYPQ